MNVDELKNIISESKVLQQIVRELDQKNSVQVKSLAGSLKTLFLSLLFEQLKRPILYIAADDDQEEMARGDLELLVGSEAIAYLPRIHEVGYQRIITDTTRKSKILSALETLVQRQRLITITAAKNLAFKFPDPGWIRKQRLVIRTGKAYDFDALKERLVTLGFSREAMVENFGELSIRGGILDIYPFSSEYPYRVEFFGDTIESIRRFDPVTQRSIDRIQQVIIYPQFPEQSEPGDEKSPGSLFAYLPKDTIIFLDESEMIRKEVEDFVDYYYKNNNNRDNKRLLVKNSTIDAGDNIFHWKDVADFLQDFVVISHNSLLSNKIGRYFPVDCQVQQPLKGSLSVLKRRIEHYSGSGLAKRGIFFLCDNDSQVQRIEDILSDAGIDCDRLNIRNFGLNQGFVFNEVSLVVFTDNQFYGRPVRWRKRKKVARGLTLQQLNSLSIGDYVVHVDHGIGQYQGLKKITVQGTERECLSLMYKNGDYLYVPLDRMNRVQKYSAKEGAVPSLSRLGSKDWDRLKKKTKKQIKDIARELIDLYARRKAQQGFAFSQDSLWQKELEASFEYEDTPDQRKATEEIKRDMEASYPMDRLICGDVGYGKTEVALRAAFKATSDSKQVAVLVPTTILALQHYNLFQERLGKYPVRIEMLSRFRTSAEQKRIVQWLKEGRIDIVIGTHRLLSKDVAFKNLGLLIIDEEHRFGVRNKERIKALQVNVDVLSMSATPIPRTLNMSLLGIRDMSLMATPPRDRLPIYTEIVPFDKKLIRMAILKEIERGGQVFFVHNRVQSIETIANLLRRLVPEISFGIAHGQMDTRQLEKVMWDFATGKYHCLVSTMIIESGLDIPNVNTLIVNRADRFGLSQLYQLRGRVGRSRQRAYAYLLVPPLHLLNKNALKRLKIIEEFTELGSGFNIAMRDLEIRGAGNIFGSQQSGHIVALGYELYTKIIEEAVQELKLEKEGKKLPLATSEIETKVEIHQDAFIPDEYIEQPELKVDIYRRLANATQIAEVERIREELKDRFGRLPQQVVNLLNLVEIKILGKLLDYETVKVLDHTLVSYFSKSLVILNRRELMEKKICSIMQKAQGTFHFVQEGKDRLGLQVDIPAQESDPIQFSKNFLKSLI